MKMRDTAEQTIGAIVDEICKPRITEMNGQLQATANQLHGELSIQGKCLHRALEAMGKVQEFVDNPGHILGSPATKHGEIAEQVEVGMVNAKAALHRLADRAVIDTSVIPRTGPVDYTIDGIPVQSKFYNGEVNTLNNGVLEHFSKYPDFVNGQNGYYHIPKDQYENILKVLNGGSTGNSARYDEKLLNLVKEIEQETGKPFTEVVKPAHANYADVQTGKIDNTIKSENKAIRAENEEIRSDIKNKAEEQKTEIIDSHKPNIQEGLKSAAAGAVVAGGITLAAKIWQKKREGKNISDFTMADWKDIGIASGKAGAKGGVSGFAIYGLTNYANCSAPVAGAVTSAAFGVASLYRDYCAGELTFEEFKESGTVICADAAVASAGAALGQMLIPVPVLGAVIGTVAANTFWKLLKDQNGVENKIDLVKLEDKIKTNFEKMNVEAQNFIMLIETKYAEIGGLIEFAFNEDVNMQLRFKYSSKLAVACKAENPLKSKADIDDYFLQ